MRLGLIIYGSLDQQSGGYLYDRKVVETLQAQGDRVEVISLPWRNPLSHLTDNFSLALWQKLSKLPIDLLIEDELNHPSLFLINGLLRRQNRYPLVSIVHHLRCNETEQRWQKPFYQWIEKTFLKSLHGIICNSRTTQHTVTTLVGEKSAAHLRSLIAYPGKDHLSGKVSEAEIEARAKEDTCLRLIFLGNLIPRKGAHWLLSALRRLEDVPFELQIVGDPHRHPTYARQLQKMVENNRLADRVHFLGRIDQRRLENLLCKAHVLVMPSSYEGFGIAYLDGLRYGLAVIGSDQGGAGELISNGVEGYLVAPGDVTTLTDRLQHLHRDRQRLAQMGMAARRRFDRHPTWAESTAKIRQFLVHLLETTPSNR